jgi:glycosyltransferase involved in cell wall biosynthesis
LEHLYFTAACLLLSPYLLVKHGYDVIHAHNPPDTLFVIGAVYKPLGKKFVFDHHDLSPELYLSRFGVRDDMIYRGLLLIERFSFWFADVCISTNESYKQLAITRGKKDPGDVFVVRNGPHPTLTQHVPPETNLRIPGKKILLYLGLMNPQDGVDHLLRALHSLVRQFKRKDFLCYLIGSGDSMGALENLVTQLELDDFVRFTGYLPPSEWIRYMSAADICLAPEPSSPLNDVSTFIKILEYMAFAKPIVSFDLKESRFTAQDAAAYALPNDENDFARKIEQLMDDPAEREARGIRGSSRIRDQLSWSHVSGNLLAAYRRLFDTTENSSTHRDGPSLRMEGRG